MDTVTSAYRNGKRLLDGEPRSEAKRRLFPADVPGPSRPAGRVQRGSLNRRRLLMVQAAGLAVTTAVTAYCVAARRRGCSDEELAPLIESLRSLASEIRASAAVGSPVVDEADSGHVE